MHFQQFCRVHYFRIVWFGTLQDKTASSVDVKCSKVVCLRESIWLILSERFDYSYCFSSVILNETTQATLKSWDSGFVRCVNAFTTSQTIDWLENHIQHIVRFDLTLQSDYRQWLCWSYNFNLVDPASSHMLVSKIKPCKSKYKLFIRQNCE